MSDHEPPNLRPPGQPISFVRRAPETEPEHEEALRAERMQRRVRARLWEIDPALAHETTWEPYDPETGRADASVSIEEASGEYQGIDLWLLCGPYRVWLLLVGYLDDAGAFRELARRTWDAPEPAADAFHREYRARASYEDRESG